jgi:large subunit ribosomal protein L28
MRCEVCHKSGMSGNNVSHSKRRTKTLFKANVHYQTVVQDGELLRVKICTRCLRSLHRSPRRAPVAGTSRPR